MRPPSLAQWLFTRDTQETFVGRVIKKTDFLMSLLCPDKALAGPWLPGKGSPGKALPPGSFCGPQAPSGATL